MIVILKEKSNLWLSNNPEEKQQMDADFKNSLLKLRFSGTACLDLRAAEHLDGAGASDPRYRDVLGRLSAKNAGSIYTPSVYTNGRGCVLRNCDL